MSAPTINANAAIFLNIQRMIGSFSLAHSSSVQPKQSPTFYLLKQLNNSCAQIDNFSPISPAWYCVTPAGDVRFGPIADIPGQTPVQLLDPVTWPFTAFANDS